MAGVHVVPRMEKKHLCLKHVRGLLREPLISEVDNLEELSSKLDEQFNFNASDDLTHFMEGETPANTERSTMWAVKIFNNWRKAWNATMTTDLFPENIFTFTHEDSIIC